LFFTFLKGLKKLAFKVGISFRAFTCAKEYNFSGYLLDHHRQVISNSHNNSMLPVYLPDLPTTTTDLDRPVSHPLLHQHLHQQNFQFQYHNGKSEAHEM